MLRVAVLTVILLLTGCSYSASVWRHPVTGDVRECVVGGYGWVGATRAAMMYGNCKDRLTYDGYVKVRTLTTEEAYTRMNPGQSLPGTGERPTPVSR